MTITDYHVPGDLLLLLLSRDSGSQNLIFKCLDSHNPYACSKENLPT